MIIGSKNDIGKIRTQNQDIIYFDQSGELPLFIVADGMGGYNAGEVASRLVVDFIVQFFKENIVEINKNVIKGIKSAIENANTAVYLKSLKNEEFKGMGTTVTLIYINDNKAYIGHVGDSRAYLIRNKEIKQLTEDHSYVNELLKLGSITEEEAVSHKDKNIITRAVGYSSYTTVDLFKKDIEAEDIFVLTSDGLTNMISDKTILEELIEECSCQDACEKLVEIANKNGGNDNISILAIKLDEV